MPLKIVGWNINGIRSTFGTSLQVLDKPTISSFLKEHKADIACFQETKTADWSKLARDLASVEGYDSFWSFSRKRKGWSGVVTFAKIGLTKDACEGFNNPAFADEGRCVMTHHDGFVLLNVYFPNAGRGVDRLDYKLKFYAAFQEACRQLSITGKQVIVTGDVNTAHKDIDIWGPKVFADSTGFLPQERAWIDSFLADGFIDAYRYFYPTKEAAYTFWDMRTMKRPPNQGWRIDYFFVSEKLKDKVTACDILPNVMGSDHCPITLELNLDLGSSKYSTPKCAGNLRSEFKQKGISSFFTQASSKKNKRPREEEEDE